MNYNNGYVLFLNFALCMLSVYGFESHGSGDSVEGFGQERFDGTFSCIDDQMDVCRDFQPPRTNSISSEDSGMGDRFQDSVSHLDFSRVVRAGVSCMIFNRERQISVASSSPLQFDDLAAREQARKGWAPSPILSDDGSVGAVMSEGENDVTGHFKRDADQLESEDEDNAMQGERKPEKFEKKIMRRK